MEVDSLDDTLRMQSGPQSGELQGKAERLLNGLYHNPQHIDLIAAKDPVMPSQETQAVWGAMLRDVDGGDIDSAALSEDLRGNDLFERIRSENVEGLIETTRHGPDSSRLEKWAHQIKEAAGRERLSELMVRMGKQARQSDQTPGEIGAHAMRLISQETAETETEGLVHVSEAVDAALEQADAIAAGESVNFIKTGFYSLDKVTGGAPIGELTMFASLSGMGKTAWVLQLVRQMARMELRREKRSGKAQRAVVFFNIEMGGEQCMWRCGSAEAGVDFRVLTRDLKETASQDDDHPRRADALSRLQAVKDEMQALKKLPIYVDNDPEPTIEQIQNRCMQVRAKQRANGCEEGEEIAVVAVDYDEKVGVGAHQSEELRVSEISKALKALAKNLNAAAIGLTQYNSKPEDEKRPGRDGDLRYSRKKHHESHTILHWWWPSYFVRKGDMSGLEAEQKLKWYDDSNPQRGKLICTKNRSGPTGRFDLDFHAETTSFTDPNEPQEPWPPSGGASSAPVPSGDTPF